MPIVDWIKRTTENRDTRLSCIRQRFFFELVIAVVAVTTVWTICII